MRAAHMVGRTAVLAMAALSMLGAGRVDAADMGPPMPVKAMLAPAAPSWAGF